MSNLIRNLRRSGCIVLAAWIGSGLAGAATPGDLTRFFRSVQVDDVTTVGKMLAARTVSPNAIDPVSREPGLIVALREDAARVAAALAADPALDPELKAPNGSTALMMASFKHNVPVVKALLARRAIVNRPGYTALHFAAAAGDDEIARILLEHHAYIDAEAPARITPLMMAAREGKESTVRLLLEEGADATLKNSEALTAAQIAERAGKPLIVAAIKAHLDARR
jgi:ankyrin repeat protein